MPTPVPIPMRGGTQRASLETEWTNDRLIPAYNLALGCFLRAFGQAETSLASYLEEFVFSELDPSQKKVPIVRGLLGSKRTPELFETTLLVLSGAIASGSNLGDGEIEEVRVAYAQLAAIRFLRDKVVHYATHPEPVGSEIWFRTVDNYTVRDLRKARWILFKIEHLDAAVDDLKAIGVRVGRALRGYKRPNPVPESETWVYAPWRLKSNDLRRIPAELHESPDPPVVKGFSRPDGWLPEDR
jgi:hypothetical protein